MNRPLRSVLLGSVLRHMVCAALLLCLVGGLRADPAQTPPAPAPNAPAPSTPAEKEAADWYQKGLAAAQADDAVKTIDYLRKAVETDPANVAYMEMLVNVLRNTSQFAPAEAFLQAEIKTLPKQEDQQRLQIALADVHSYWARSLADSYHFEEVIAQYQAAFAIDQKLRRRNAAIDLNSLGATYRHLSQYDKAINYYQQALPIRREVKDRSGEAVTLNNLGAAYVGLSQYDKAINYYQQALPIRREVKDRDGEATTLNNLGGAYDDLSQYSKAIDFYQQALPILRQVKDRNMEATTLNNLGATYRHLSQYDKAIDFYQQALPIMREVKDRDGEATTLSNLGAAHDDLSQYSKAIDYYQQALTIMREVKNREGEATTLNNLGAVDDSLSQHEKAVDLYQQALFIHQEVKDRQGEAVTLSALGVAYDHLRQYEKAIDFSQQALVIRREVKDQDGEATTLNNLMFTWNSLAKPGLAVFYGKQAVNVIQSIRANINPQDKEGQKSYLAANAHTYRTLADLLIQQGRLPEAQQVLKMLKEREFYEYLHPDPNAPPPTMDSLPGTPREDKWAGRYAEAAKPLADLGQQEQDLLAVKTRTPAQDAQLADQETRLRAAADALTQVQKAAAADFAGPPTPDDTPPNMTAVQDLQNALPPATVALYTIVAPDKLLVIAVTHDTQKAYSSLIKADALYDKVRAFRQALGNTDVDPSPLAADLYHLIFGATLITKSKSTVTLSDDPQIAHATTLLFSLDDALRYIPPAALYDPERKQYLAERYQTALITLAAAPSAPTPPLPPAILGLGTSDKQGDLPALPGVRDELMAIVHDHEQNDTGGLMPGKRLMNGQFTEASLEAGLKSGTYPFVHVASHFSLQGTEDTSFLLLGDGRHLTVATLAQDPHRFAGVTLLTLSACDTAMEVKRSSGREVEQIGTLAQKLGAKAVLASLWPVSDAATPPLMAALYGYRQTHPAAPLSEALQAAQWTLIHGHAPASGDLAHRGTEAVSAPAGESLPAFVADPKAPYAHPYYWAPFILIGNWK